MSERRPVLPLPLIMLVTDRTACGERRLEDVVAAAVDGGVNVVQVREKDLPAAELLGLCGRLRQIVGGRALVLVNDRLDVALAAGVDGVQLGGSSLPCTVARQLAPDLVIGCSVHDVAHAAEAVAESADLLVVGTMFASRSHPGLAPAGPSLLRKVAALTTVPLVGIGGITPANARQLIAAGASGVAAISAISLAPDPRSAATRLVAAVQEAWPTAPLHRRH
ncbi:MAG: thiamine phosphate synthase [Chloroflexota bacterium]